jgi:hypothetical protein
MVQFADDIAKFLVWIVMFLFVISWGMKNEPRWYFWGKISLLAMLGALYGILSYGGKCSWWVVVVVFTAVAFNVVLKLPVTDKKEAKNAGK